MHGIILAAGCALLAANDASAAWFDCDKAKTKMEKAICKDPSLSRLDDTLSMVYYDMKDSVADPIALRKEQRAWLAGLRKGYKPGFDLASAYRSRIAIIRKLPGYAWKRYSNKALRLEFEYPGNRVIRVDEQTATIKIVSALAEDDEGYLAEIGIRNGDFESLADSIGFEKRKDGWYYPNGRCGDVKAKPISGKGWKGYSALTDGSVFGGENGNHACAGSTVYNLFGNGLVSVAFTMDGGPDADRFSRTLKSLRILPEEETEP